MSNFFDDDGFGPARIPDRPERPRPRPLDTEVKSKWVPSPESDPSSSKPLLRLQIDHIVRRLLPLLGLAILVGIAVAVGSFVAGVYR